MSMNEFRRLAARMDQQMHSLLPKASVKHTLSSIA